MIMETILKKMIMVTVTNDDDDDDDVEEKRRRKGNGDCELISAIPVFLHTPHRPPPLTLTMQ